MKKKSLEPSSLLASIHSATRLLGKKIHQQYSKLWLLYATVLACQAILAHCSISFGGKQTFSLFCSRPAP